MANFLLEGAPGEAGEDEKEVSDQRCHSHAISDSLTQWPPIRQTNSTSTLLLLLSRPPDRLEEGEKEPTDEASDQPSVTTVDSDTKNSTGLRFWSSTTHLRLHSITVSTVTLIHCKKATDASNFPISLSGPVRLCSSIF
nr:hypothetical protein CFP56_64202 [Quercus suber]